MCDILSMLGDIASIISWSKDYYRSVRDTRKSMNDIIALLGSWVPQLELLGDLLGPGDETAHRLQIALTNNSVLNQVQGCLEELKSLLNPEGAPTPEHSSKRHRIASAYEKLTWPLGKQEKADRLLKELETHKSNIDMILSMKTSWDMTQLRKVIENTEAAKATDKERRRILAWLKPDGLDSYEIHLEKSDLREQETCDWMTNSDIWEAWTRGGSLAEDGYRRFVWIHGIPGSGKTILASFLIDKIGSHCGGKGRSYYYCSHQRAQDETRSFLQWVVGDFCNQSDRFVSNDLLDLYKRHQGNVLGVSVEDLLRCLLTVTRQFGTQVFIIVDAVDESLKPRNHLMKILTTIGTDPEFSHVSLLMISRDEQDIRAAIEGLPLLNTASSFVQRGLGLTPLASPSCVGPSPFEVQRLGQTQGLGSPTSSRITRPMTPTGHPNRVLATASGSTGSSSTTRQFDTRSPTPQQQSLVRKFSATDARESDHDGPPYTPTRCVSQANQRPLAPARSPRRGILLSENLKLNQPYTELSMDNQFVLKAIQVYVYNRLERVEGLRDLRPEFLYELGLKLARESRGMFRWAACQIDTIIQLDLIDKESIQKLLGNLPKTVFGIYERLLIEHIPQEKNYTDNNCTFARTALALICSNSSEIPNAEVLVQASLFNVARGWTHRYDLRQLQKLLGCLIKVTPMIRKPPSVFRRDAAGAEDADGVRLRVAPAHYTVKEYLFHKDTAQGPAKDFALSHHATQILELEMAFNGLLQFDNRGPRNHPTRYEEYCLRMTDKALRTRRALIVRERSIWKAVLQCLRYDCAHQDALRTQIIRQAFPRWARLNGLFRADRGAGAPKHQQTAILISLLQLSWPELAAIYLDDQAEDDLQNVWYDTFTLASTADGRNNAGRVRQTFLELCVSRRRIDFLEHLIEAGADFADENHILYAALEEPYVQGSYSQSGKGNGRGAGGEGLAPRQDDGATTGTLLKMLLQQGANPNPEGYNYTPLQVAVRHLEERWVQSLLLEQADPNEVGDPNGVHPYHDSGRNVDDEDWFQHHPLRICREASPPWDHDAHDFEFDEQVLQARIRVQALLMQYGAREPDEDEEMEDDRQPVTITLDC